MGAFFDWLLSNLNWIIPVIFILAFALPILSVIRRLTKGHVSKNSCTVQTVGFIRSTQQTGMYFNENPQLLFELDALAEDGTVFQTSVRKVIPMTAMAGMVPGRAIPIRYNPDNRTQAVWDNHPDESLAQERAARYQCRRHPGELTYEQRMELNRNSVVKKALLENLRLTGKEEAGDWEAKVTVRITDNAAGDTVMNRTLYLNDKMLKHMVPGKYIDISVVPGKEDFFGIVTDIATKVVPEKSGS